MWKERGGNWPYKGDIYGSNPVGHRKSGAKWRGGFTSLGHGIKRFETKVFKLNRFRSDWQIDCETFQQWAVAIMI
jgi:hypothetical protein